ncbi:Clavaminate synthase-like protein [Hypoxylon sp. NC1633]|nr:Clavaminate synthase-like protein [Hypoxylon sp. NC1633]
MSPSAGLSRSLLSCECLHGCSSSLGRSLGRTPTKTFTRSIVTSNSRCGVASYLNVSRLQRTVDKGLVPWPKERLRLDQNTTWTMRGLATQAGSDETTPGATNLSGNSTTKIERKTKTNDPSIQIVDDSTIHISLPDRPNPLVLDRHWLRDACRCSICVDPDSGQKNFGTCDVPTELPVEKVYKTEEGGLEVVWEKDFLTPGEHVSRYPPGTLDHDDPYFRSDEFLRLPRKTLWDKAIFEQEGITVEYDDWMSGKQEFLDGMHQLQTYGLVFIRNVPSSEESVISIANQIGDLKETFYGRTWDVRSKPNAENVAYTSSFLGLHQDLLYMRDAPRVQILHCLENSCEGGESIFSDGLRAAHLMKLGPKDLIDALKDRKIRYHYKKHGHYYEFSRAVVSNILAYVFWSPPFQDSRQRIQKTKKGTADYRVWLQAATKFRQLLEDEHWVYQYKMQPGDCVLFDNLRLVHGRRQFDTASGSRWLKGTYISQDVFTSKMAALKSELTKLETSEDKLPLEEQAVGYEVKHHVWESLL